MAKPKVTPELAVAVVVPSVPSALEVIDREIKSLKHITDSTYVTSGKINGANGQVDIKSETKQEVLVKAFASISARAADMENAYAELGISEYPVVKIDGSTVNEWKKDITLRLAVIQHKDRLDELNALKAQWQELMDKDDRKALLLKKMQEKGLVA